MMGRSSLRVLAVASTAFLTGGLGEGGEGGSHEWHFLNL